MLFSDQIWRTNCLQQNLHHFHINISCLIFQKPYPSPCPSHQFYCSAHLQAPQINWNHNSIYTSAMQTSQPTIAPPTIKVKRSGRWTEAESTLFEELIEKYGKNWKKIHSHIRGRTLCQIRSHAQKFFERIGPARTKEFQRKAKVLEAIETLEHEKLLQKASASTRAKQERKFLQPIIKQEENPIPPKPQFSIPSGTQNRSGELSRSEYIKEQFEQSEDRRMQAPLISQPMVHSPLAEQTSECMYAPFYWYPNAFAMSGLGNGGNPYNLGYM